MSIQFPGSDSYNYVKNPAMREDTGGLADDWSLGGSYTDEVIPTIVGDAGFNWQRLQYTGVAGDAGGKTIDLAADESEVATFAASDLATAQFLVKGAVAGAGIAAYLGIIVTDASDVYLASYFEQFTPAVAEVVVAKSLALPALASRVSVFMRVLGIANGDTVDISVTKAMVEKTSAVNAYWDGASGAGTSWSGAADASASIKDASGSYAADLQYAAPADVTLAGGTLAYVFAPGEPMTAASKNASHVSLGSDTLAWSDDRKFAFTIGSGGTPTELLSAAADRVRDVDHLVVIRWDDVTADLCLDGTHVAEVERTDSQGVGAIAGPVRLAGHGVIPYAQRFGLLLLSPERKTKEWVDALYAAWLTDPAERVAIFENMMSDGERIAVFDGTSTLYPKKNTPPLFSAGGRALVAYDGNSMTYGIGATRGLDDYPTVCTALLPGRWTLVNQGVAGLNTSGCIAAAAAGIDPTWSAGYKRSVCVFWEGTNSLADPTRTIAEELALWHTYCDARRAVGFEKIVVLTVLPTTDAAREAAAITKGYTGWEQERLAFNTLLKANFTDFADRCLDIGAHAIMGDVAHCSDGVYYSDAIHPAAAGYAVIGGLVAAVIKDVLR